MFPGLGNMAMLLSHPEAKRWKTRGSGDLSREVVHGHIVFNDMARRSFSCCAIIKYWRSDIENIQFRKMQVRVQVPC